ncbi:UDP-N-acetylglucosamine transporter UGNT1 isoform X5 [Carya illinoinensis]|uniref:UDP-N-acetylglucosamine transporter UGNT1 isoform X5 n=1 Tax=Carya illinoinensis TaxID=32201 RepID=UPI001C725827|nr:UDP-N-acetylglucosamine transporter UGNT1 isoform X5 [Carya illinoinensis]
MSLKASSSSKYPVLPVSDPPRDEERDKLLKGNEMLFQGSAMTKRGAYASISYMSCAVLLILFNKAALSSYSFPCANVITLFQEHICFTCHYGVCPWSKCSHVHHPQADYCGIYNGCGVYSGRAEVHAFYCWKDVISVGLIVLGAFIAGARDFSFDGYGYAVVFLSNITTAIYLATIARIGKSSGLNSFGLMWCNGVICGPVLLFWTFTRGDLEITINFPYLLSPGFLAVLLCSCILAFFLNYSIFLNTTLNSALTQTICGNLKDLFTIGFGWMVFGGLPFDVFNVIGQLLSFLGSGLYAYYKLVGK